MWLCPTPRVVLAPRDASFPCLVACDLVTTNRLCGLTEKKLAKLTELGRERFRVLKYEMVRHRAVAARMNMFTKPHFGGWLEPCVKAWFHRIAA